jgi:hypothetical protein
VSKPFWVSDPRAKGGGFFVEALEIPGTRTRAQEAKRAKKREPFKVDWVKLPDYWIRQLERSQRVGTYKLALRILREAYKQQYTGGEVVLSAEVTGLPGTTRWSATKELVALNLIQIQQDGNRATRVTKLLLEPLRPRLNLKTEACS